MDGCLGRRVPGRRDGPPPPLLSRGLTDEAGCAPMPDYSDVPLEVLGRLRSVCAGLPDAVEEQAWAGTRWRIRKRTFVHVLTVDSADGPVTAMTFRSSG